LEGVNAMSVAILRDLTEHATQREFEERNI